jgi:ornithine cyclodeaminase
MTNQINIVPLEKLKTVFDRDAIIEKVKEAYIAHADGKVISPPPGQLLFDEPKGDCHIKFGKTKGMPFFVIKIACGFYDNPKIGLPVNSGLIIVMNAKNGTPVALLADQGWLTSWRTAAAGFLAAKSMLPSQCKAIGMIGSGHQAKLQLEWIRQSLDTKRVYVWNVDEFKDESGRFVESLNNDGFDACLASSIGELAEECRLIYTTTPSTRALFDSRCIKPGTHIVAIGADSPGKQELDSEVFSRARTIATDDHNQCIDHGDFGNAVRAGQVSKDADVKFGDILGGRITGRTSDEDITIVDLTGIPALDIAIATLFCERLGIN